MGVSMVTYDGCKDSWCLTTGQLPGQTVQATTGFGQLI